MMRALMLSALIVALGLSCFARQTEYQALDPASCIANVPDRTITYGIDLRFNASQEAMIVEAMDIWTSSTGRRVVFQRQPTWLVEQPELWFIFADDGDELPPHAEINAAGLHIQIVYQ